MPLRDHFRPPIWKYHSWEGFHGMWPAVIVQKLTPLLPESYVAEPRAHLGAYYEIDVCAFESSQEEVPHSAYVHSAQDSTALHAAPQPTLTLDAEIGEEYAYEVLVFDRERQQQLVAAIEIVSPANKDRPDSRRAFVAKCAALLQQRVCVSIVDLVTIRRFNLYTELLDYLNCSDPTFRPEPPRTYAATCRGRMLDGKRRLELWAYPIAIGNPLPAIPIWLSDDAHVTVDLEASYEDTCRALRIS